jgi:small basic protein
MIPIVALIIGIVIGLWMGCAICAFRKQKAEIDKRAKEYWNWRELE